MRAAIIHAVLHFKYNSFFLLILFDLLIFTFRLPLLLLPIEINTTDVNVISTVDAARLNVEFIDFVLFRAEY